MDADEYDEYINKFAQTYGDHRNPDHPDHRNNVWYFYFPQNQYEGDAEYLIYWNDEADAWMTNGWDRKRNYEVLDICGPPSSWASCYELPLLPNYCLRQFGICAECEGPILIGPNYLCEGCRDPEGQDHSHQAMVRGSQHAIS